MCVELYMREMNELEQRNEESWREEGGGKLYYFLSYCWWIETDKNILVVRYTEKLDRNQLKDKV